MRFLRDFYFGLSSQDRALLIVGIALALATGFYGDAVLRAMFTMIDFGAAAAAAVPA